MPDRPISVSKASDIRSAHLKISGRDVEAVRTNLEANPEQAALWLAEWLTEEKPLEYVYGDAQVAVVTVDRETAKAWGVKQAGDNDLVWVPKSQAVVFELEDGVTEIESGQSRLTDL